MADDSKYPFTLFKHGEAKEIKNSGEEAKAREQGFTEPYKYQEYPKALYRNGERVEVSWDSVEKLADGGCRVVNSKDEEDAARKDGYRMLHEPAPEPEKKDEGKGEQKGDDAQGAQTDADAGDDAKGNGKRKNAK